MYPSVPTYPTRPSNRNKQNCYERQVNVTDSITNITETTTETVCNGATSSSSSSSSSGGAIAGVVIGVLIIVGIVIAVLCCCAQLQQNQDEENKPDPLAVFMAEPESWNEIRQSVQDDSANMASLSYPDAIVISKPPNGTYESVYEEDGRTLKSSIDLRFVGDDWEQQHGWSVQGSGHDADGNFLVTEGLLSASGVVYWIEKCNAGIMLTHGKFNSDGWTFQGRYHAANGVSGTFTSFQLVSSFNNSTGTDTDASSDDEPEIAVAISDDGKKGDEPEISLQV